MIMIMSNDINENGLKGVFTSHYCLSKLHVKLVQIFKIVKSGVSFEQLYVLKFSCVNG